MKTQISRDSFDDSKRFSGVYLQQGRMVVDADLNELSDIAKRRLDAALADVVASGAPRQGALSIGKSGAQFVVHPGRLVVDGVPARLHAAADLPLNAQPDYRHPPALPANHLRIYADVWERAVGSIEDGDLQDPGLHGADTATRTRTLLQVKWCADAVDPLDPAVNPRIGNGLVTLKLRKINTGSDPCDPCAAEVPVDERIGNYLFRVEVHDLFVAAGETHLVLKWSRDNGAEAYPWDAYPLDFNQGDWVWEYFDSDSENLLGHHFPAGETRRRGQLQEVFTRPAAPNAFVRQWDGYAEFNLSTAALIRGRDRGVPLSTGLADTAHAYVKLDGAAGTVLANLELLELSFGYRIGADLRQFMAGDYWQVPVREAIHKSGDTVLGSGGGALPRGVRHHYLLLAEVDNAGNLVPFTDARRRQMGFPPLTDLRAVDVGFSDHCSGLYAGAENVQQALDALCHLGAEDIGYSVPGCGSDEAPSVASLMAATLARFPDLDEVPKSPSVKDILDALMCHLNARRLPYEPAGQAARWSDINEGGAAPLTVQQALDDLVAHLDAGDIAASLGACTDGTGSGSLTLRELMGLGAGQYTVADVIERLFCNLRATHLPLDRSTIRCNEIKADPNVLSVQDALDKLCEGMGNACEISVPEGGLDQVLRDFAASDSRHLSLCLMPGNHILSKDLFVKDKSSLRIRGAGGTHTLVMLSDHVLDITAAEIALEDLGISLRSPGRVRLCGDRLSSTRCAYGRLSGGPTGQPMVLLERLESGDMIAWRDNVLGDIWYQAHHLGALEAEAVGNVKVSEAMERLRGAPELFVDPERMSVVIGDIADAVIEMPVRERQRWAQAIDAALAAPAPPPGGGLPGAENPPPPRRGRLPGSLHAQPTRRRKPGPADAARFTGPIVAAAPDRAAVVAGVAEGLTRLLFDSGVNTALAISSHYFSGVLQANKINGELLLMNELALDGEARGVDAAREVSRVNKEGTLVPPGGGVLTLEGNRIDRLWSLVKPPVDGVLEGPIPGQATCTLSGNQFIDVQHSLVSAKLAMHGNHFEWTPENNEWTTPLGLLLVNQATVIGNLSADTGDGIPSMLVASRSFRSNSNFFIVTGI